MNKEVIRAANRLCIPENEIKDRYLGYFGWEEADEDFNFSYKFNKDDNQSGIYNTLKTLEYYAYCEAKRKGELSSIPRKFIRQIDWSYFANELYNSGYRVYDFHVFAPFSNNGG